MGLYNIANLKITLSFHIPSRYIILDEYPCEEFCDAYWIKFFSISSARIAKQKLDNKSFYGKLLHVSYAPESEEVTDVREKLVERKQCVLQKTEGIYIQVESALLTVQGC